VTLAYVILAHKLPAQLGRLVSAVYHPDDLFYVHIDAKVPDAPFRAELSERFTDASNIRYVSRVRCDWAGFGHVEATLRGMKAALARSSSFTHVLLLTGQDYPIKPIEWIRGHFASHAGRSFMSWSAGDAPSGSVDRTGNAHWFWNGDLGRLERRFYLVAGRWRQLPNRFVPFVPRRQMPLGFRPYQGLAYWNLSIEAAEYVLRLTEEKPELIRFFRRVWGCDEFFFQMALLNSPLRETLVNEDLRYMSWDGYHPLTLRSADLEALARSPKFFARKVDSSVDVDLLDRIDRTLL
jgi:hypothetical protein